MEEKEKELTVEERLEKTEALLDKASNEIVHLRDINAKQSSQLHMLERLERLIFLGRDNLNSMAMNERLDILDDIYNLKNAK